MVAINPQRIVGKWRIGYALGRHTLSSTYLGADQFGHDKFDTKRSGIGELLYQLKYHRNSSVLPEIVDTIAGFLAKSFSFEMIVPVPASTPRPVQPVAQVANALGERLGLPVMHCVSATRATMQLKDVYDLAQRQSQLEGLYAVNADVTRGKRILLFDDLFRSGATMNAITALTYEVGGAADVCALTLTCTRTKS